MMVKAPTPEEEEDRRRLCRERKVLTNDPRAPHSSRLNHASLDVRVV